MLHHDTGNRRLAFWANFANRQSPALAASVAWCANTHIVALDVVDAFLSRQSLVPDPAFVAAVRTALESLRPATTGTGERHPKPAKHSVS